MTANEFSMERVDSLHNIVSATPAANDKDKKHHKEPQPTRKTVKNGETSDELDTDGLTVPPEDHAIDFQA
jgi:hypothetical protein